MAVITTQTRAALLLSRPSSIVEQVSVEAVFLSALEDDVAVIDEDDRRGVLLRLVEHAMDHLVEMLGPGDEGPIDEKELAPEAMGQRPADRRLPRAGRPGQQHPSFRLELQFLGQFAVLQRDHDVRFEAADHVVDPLEVVKIDLGHLAQLDVARQLHGPQIVDEPIRRDLGGLEPGAGASELMAVEVRREAMDLLQVQVSDPILAQKSA